MTITHPNSTTTLTINLNAVRENYQILKDICGVSCKVSAVVKADAYGLGFAPIVKTLAGQGCDEFFVASIDEAIELREVLPKATIFALHGFFQGQEEIFVRYNITPVLNLRSQVNLWQQYAVLMNKILPCLLHYNTGMNRLGLSLNDSEELARNNAITQNLDVKYTISHLACSDDDSSPMNAQQLLEFQSIMRNTKSNKLSFANSGGIFLGKDYHFNMVRPGLALYGGNPNNSTKNPMKNVVTLTSKMLQIHRIDRAGSVGYGASHKVEAGAKIATISVGYADGYLRSLSNNGVCAIDGVLVPVVGRVSMDLVTINVTKIPDGELEVGKEVELIGKNIPLELVAEKAGTISYEILTSLGARYKRVYEGFDK